MRAATLILGLALCASAGAQDSDVQTVQIDGVKNPQMKSYRAVVAGLDMFEKEHSLAPAAPGVRFRMLSRGKQALPDTGVTLRIASDDESFAVPVDADGLFVVPRKQSAYDAKAELIFNLKKDAFKVTPDIRTPGLPDNVRRLGDLRLECKVSLAIAKEEIPFWLVATINTVLLGTDWCMNTKGKMNFSFSTPAQLAGASLSAGERSIKLNTKKDSFTVPINDRSWPDDALVQLQYATEASPDI